MINVEFNNEINDLITENLYQWDTFQTLKIKGINFGSVAPKVHFSNKKATEALVVNAVIQADGGIEVSIPNSLLTEKYDILAYVYMNTGLTGKTIKSITIPIIPRLKPSEYYQPTDEDIAEIEAIELEARAIIDNLYGSEYDNAKTYKRPNIVYYNHSAYMCNSAVEITGVLPTDNTKWVKIVDGAVVTNITKNSSGNLMFVLSNGSTYTVDMAVQDVALVDDVEIPALNLTSEEVNKIKNAKALNLTEDEVNYCKKIKALSDVPTDTVTGYYAPRYPGLYSVLVKDKETLITHTVLMSIPKVSGTMYYSTPFTNIYGNFYVKYSEISTGLWGFSTTNSSNGGVILDVKLIMTY